MGGVQKKRPEFEFFLIQAGKGFDIIRLIFLTGTSFKNS